MTFGSSCVNPCGQCSRGVPCDPVTGACPGSCQPGWTGDKCDTGMYACGTSMPECLGLINNDGPETSPIPVCMHGVQVCLRPSNRDRPGTSATPVCMHVVQACLSIGGLSTRTDQSQV